MIDSGLSHYHQMCVTCHGAPGIKASEIGKGLYPRPPSLAEEAAEHSPAELFWTVKNGLKMTGMPAYGAAHDDESLWGIVAFLKKLPELSPAQYEEMVIRAGLNSTTSGGHSDHQAHGSEAAEEKEGQASHRHESGSGSHGHDHYAWHA